MKKANVVSLLDFRKNKTDELQENRYRRKIEAMDKFDLLNEMVLFQEERTRRGSLSLSMIRKGRILFARLEAEADTQALQSLSRSYKRHLDYELATYQNA